MKIKFTPHPCPLPQRGEGFDISEGVEMGPKIMKEKNAGSKKNRKLKRR
ncbi:MAG: hypothetical protein ACPL28_08510 [bacterium]